MAKHMKGLGQIKPVICVCMYSCECSIPENLKSLQGLDTIFLILILISFILEEEEGKMRERERECCSWQKIQATGCFMALP